MPIKIKNYLRGLEKVLLTLFLFLFPSQAAIHFWPENSFVFGIRIDYLSPAIYLTDVLPIFLIVLWFFLRKNEFLAFVKKRKKILLIFILFAVVNIAFSTLYAVSFFRWAKIFLFLLTAFYLNSKKNLSLTPLFVSAVFFSVIGILQFAAGKTLGGLMYFLGERSFDVNTPGIALRSLFGRDFLRAYSTFPHPNSMAGYLGAVFVLFFFGSSVKKRPIVNTGLLIIFISFILTFSAGGVLGLAAVFSLYPFLKTRYRHAVVKLVLASVLAASFFQLVFSETYLTKSDYRENLQQRMELSASAKNIISRNPITGVGLNTFIPNLANRDGLQKITWILQPVHNIFLLVFAECGLLGLGFFVSVLYRGLEKIGNRNNTLILVFLFVMITGTVDHYWITLQQNNLLLMFLISYFI